MPVIPTRINFIHYGDALERFVRAKRTVTPARMPKDRFVGLVGARGESDIFVSHIVNCYGGRRRQTIDLDAFFEDIGKSESARAIFNSVGCRGFSYEFVTRPTGFPVQLRGAIDVRVGIFADTRYNYPPGVQKYLVHDRSSHYYHYFGPAIGFLLGMMRGNNLFVVTLQSDITCNTPSALREHFRGWRRILINLTLQHIAPDRCFIARSDDILRACHNGYEVPANVPRGWLNIYEQTAKDYAAACRQLARGLNIQIYPRHPKVIANQFYQIK